jgi:hypothetical protein
MIRTKQDRTEPIVVDLTGPQGNAFWLLGYAKQLAKQLSFDYKVIEQEMMEGDYENLVNTFDKYFGDYVILER